MPKLNNAAGDGYRGPAPPPARTLDLTGGEVEVVQPNVFNQDGSPMEMSEPGPQTRLSEYAANFDRQTQPIAPLPEALAPSVPGPAVQPVAAPNEMQELRATVEKLTQAVASRVTDDAHRVAEDKRRDLQMAAINAVGASPAQGVGDGDLFQGMDDDDTLTVGQARQFAAQMGQLVPAAAKQAVWDITQEEINAVFAENPILHRTPQPQRTDLVQQFVQNRRDLQARNVEPVEESRGTGAQSNARETREVPGRVVPHVEGGGAPASAVEPQAAEDTITYARRMYEEARANRSLSRKERHRHTRHWRDQILIAQGRAPGSEFDGGFIETTEAPLG